MVPSIVMYQYNNKPIKHQAFVYTVKCQTVLFLTI